MIDGAQLNGTWNVVHSSLLTLPNIESVEMFVLNWEIDQDPPKLEDMLVRYFGSKRRRKHIPGFKIYLSTYSSYGDTYPSYIRNRLNHLLQRKGQFCEVLFGGVVQKGRSLASASHVSEEDV